MESEYYREFNKSINRENETNEETTKIENNLSLAASNNSN